MRLLVLGGTRFIGPAVVRTLVDQGHEVAVFHRGQNQADLPRSVVRLSGDRTRLAACATEFARLAPDVVIDTFAMTEADAESVVRSFAGLAGRLVVLSSMDVYRAYDQFRGAQSGDPDPAPLTEDSVLRQTLFPYRGQATDEKDLLYNYEKILVERVVLSHTSLPATVLRLPCVYGPGDYQHRTFEYLKRMDDGRSTILLGQLHSAWRWTRGYVEEVAVAVALAATDEKAAGQTYNVGEPESLCEADWVRRIGDAADWRGRVLVVPEDELPPHLQASFDWRHHISGDTTKIRRELGYQERVPRETAMAQTVAWERSHPPTEIDAQQFDYQSEDAAIAQAGVKSI
jgi:nucleoside-diphosphate-sugar epimerase